MNINRYNYEEYFLLYTDNELNAEDKALVEQFAAVHADLREELEQLQQSVIRPEKHLVFTGKASLMKLSVPGGGINELNFEAYFILYLDNELSSPEKAAVESLLYTHPALESTFEQFQQAKLEMEKITFPAKESLYRHEKERKVIPMRWRKIAAAAAVILVAGLFWLNQSSVDGGHSGLAEEQKIPGTASNVATGKKENIKRQGNLPIDKDQYEKDEYSKAQKQVIASNSSSEKTDAISPNKQLQMHKKRRSQSVNHFGEQDYQGLAKKALVTVVPSHEQINTSVIKVDEHGKQVTIVKQATHQDVKEDNTATLTFAADQPFENVFLTNISVDNNAPLRGLLRKASRVVNKVAALKRGHKPGISIGNVEIAIQ